MLIVDIVKTESYDKEWEQCLDYIEHSCLDDPLHKNYINLKKLDFISLPVVILDNKIIAFSGAQIKDEWGPNIARVSSRFWIHPLHRHSITKFNESSGPWYNSEYLIKVQLEEIRKKEIPHVFISREGEYRKSFQKFIDLVNYYNQTNFKILDDYYNILTVPQLLAVHSFEGNNLEQYLIEETLIKKI